METDQKGAGMPDKHKYIILFDDGREISTPPAEELDFEPQAEGVMRKGRVKLLGGSPATIILNMDKVLAVYPVAATPGGSLPQRHASQHELFEAAECERKVHEEVKRRERGQTDQKWREREHRRKETRATQSKELDREIAAALNRFNEMKDSHLMRPYPILRNFEQLGRVPAEVAEFVRSREAVRERMNYMLEDDLVVRNSDGWYSVTEQGAKLAALGLSHVRKGSSPSLLQHRRVMVDICQSIMASVPEEARWVTNRELLDDGVRTRLEAEVGRRLPVGRLSPAPQTWPSTPQGVLILQEPATTSAVELELTQVSKTKLAHYEVILEDLAKDPSLDLAYLVFQEEDALRRVEELAHRYRDDGFFVFNRIEDPLGLRRREA